MSRVEREDPAIRELHKLKPARLAVFVRGSDVAKMVPLTGGHRWEKMARTLDALAWERIEALDAKGELLGVIEPDSGDDAPAVEGMPDQVERYVRITMEAVSRAQRETREMFAAQMDAMTNTITAVVDGLRVVQDSYGVALKMQQALTAAAAGKESDDLPIAQMLQMAMAIKAGSPAQLAAAMPKTAPAQQPKVVKPTNGAS
jgi:hypothetical protein